VLQNNSGSFSIEFYVCKQWLASYSETGYSVTAIRLMEKFPAKGSLPSSQNPEIRNLHPVHIITFWSLNVHF